MLGYLMLSRRIGAVEAGYEGQVLDQDVRESWLAFSVRHPDAKARATRLAQEIGALIGDGWKIGIESPSAFTLMVRSRRVTTSSLERHFTLFKTWLSPSVKVSDEREWLEGPMRQAFARAGLSDAAIEFTGETPHFG